MLAGYAMRVRSGGDGGESGLEQRAWGQAGEAGDLPDGDGTGGLRRLERLVREASSRRRLVHLRATHRAPQDQRHALDLERVAGEEQHGGVVLAALERPP